jgi:hypothetical protein
MHAQGPDGLRLLVGIRDAVLGEALEMRERIGIGRAERGDELFQIGLHVRERLQGRLGRGAVGLRALHVADRGRLIGRSRREHLLEIAVVRRQVEAGRLHVGQGRGGPQQQNGEE